MVLRARSTPILSLTSDPTSPYLLGLVPAEALGRRPAGVCRHGVDGHDGGLLIRVGVGSIAAGTRGVRDRLHLLYVVDVRQRAGGRRITRGTSDLFVSGSIHPKPGNLATATVDADMQGNSRLQLANLETGGDSATAFREPDHQPK